MIVLNFNIDYEYKLIKKILIIIVIILDLLLIPITILSILWFKVIRKSNIERMNFSRKLFNYFGLLPIHSHYYEPLINPKKHLLSTLKNDRKLLGIDFNVDKQKELIDSFNYNDELLEFPVNNINNDSFFILVGHSQGTNHAVRLINEFIQYDNFVYISVRCHTFLVRIRLPFL